ncbi:MAG: NADH-quinone oxidoreductase subunit C [Intrasporangium sp.]|uniref:NADH-quinone oxidoreductase subunit C n=1 Tax=Intrasporangium sp. TaxID=1925024 RepID=UPI002647DAE0|nr:NADH-quinone oxidoreductase subunit C [Intrasporangium sp.]MDN5794630.1 NADH-quinone oxidoreductase subunit C [Intrasporangium sp.]
MKVTQAVEIPLAEWVSSVGDHVSQGFSYFDWLTAVDQTDATDEPGFDVVVHLLDVTAPERLRSVLLRTRVPDGAAVASLTPVFHGAAWHERETHEMFGIDFAGFDDGTGLGLRPLLLPDGFEGTPLRKSFMLAARASKPWPGAKEPGEGHGEGLRSGAPSRRRVQAPGVPPPEWGPR